MGNMSEIQNGTKYSVFKRRVLDKNTLTRKGSLYIGTGVERDGVYETEEIAPPSVRKTLGCEPSTMGDNVGWMSDTAAYIAITNERYFSLLVNNKIDENAIYVIFEEE